MVEMNEEMEEYFASIQRKVNQCYDIAEQARQKGLDPELSVESPQAKDLAGRVEKLVGPDGVAAVIRDLKKMGKSDNEITFHVVQGILDKKIGNIESLEGRVDRAIRVGLAIKTMGVVSAPLEGISKILIRQDQQGKKYLSLYFAGPIRAAGGTTAALCVLIADYVRKKTNIPKYQATDGEIGRYVEEVKLYDRIIHLQYPSSNDEIRYAVKHLPVEINGDPTEEEEVSAFRNLPRVETNRVRGGACLVLNDGILSKKSKLLLITQTMNLEGWEWLSRLKEIAEKDSDEEDKDDELEQKVLPNYKYIADLLAGRPVFSHPSRVGGHRIRYGKSRNTSLAAAGIHPATMLILDNFVAIGTQLRIERPGKSTSVCPVSGIEPPIVKLKNGEVIKVSNTNLAKKIFPEIKKILFLGDILFGFGEFAENNHKLLPSGYVEEWWALELEKAVEEDKKIDDKIKSIIKDPFNNIPTAEEAVKISEDYNIPLHPAYLDFWGNLPVFELNELRKVFITGYQDSNNKIILENNNRIKSILEKAFIPHKIKDDKIIFSNAMNHIYKTIFNLDSKAPIKLKGFDDAFSYFDSLSSIKIKDKAPYFMGTRMGRPEKSERKSMKGIHALFPLSDKVGNSRLVEKAMKLVKEDEKEPDKKKGLDSFGEAEKKTYRINIDVCRKKCPKCGEATIFNLCPRCKVHTELMSICENCKKLFEAVDPKEDERCPQCNQLLKGSSGATFNIKNYINSTLKNLQLSFPKQMKGIFGLTNRFKVPEPIEKGILRAKNDVLVYKTAEIRYDATDIPLTHFKLKEIGCSISKLKELGYRNDYKGNPIHDDNQIIELKVQDILLSNDCAEYMIKVANFLDDELDYFYKMDRFYKVKNREDLIGHIVVGLAPHTSAGIIGRIIGFTPARSIYAHPFWHAAKRRNCDGDEDGLMMLLDPLLNFSKSYLPSKIGGRMDATLVISTKLDPNEIDEEAHNVDTLSKYPLEFYEATHRYASPSDIKNIMRLVKSRLGTPEQYNSGFNIPTDDINDGNYMTAYKTYETMDEKIEAQVHLAELIEAVDEKNVAEKVLQTHFNPDILGNLRKFAVQGFRCVKCNEKYRRPPISNGGKCTKCGNRVILTVNRGGIEKYIPRAIKLCKDYNLDEYTLQRMELIEEYVKSLTNNPKIRQQKLSDFF